MVNYEDLLRSIGSNPDDLCAQFISGVKADDIRENVIIAPWWEPDTFENLDDFDIISTRSPFIVWNSDDITYIKTGIGAPLMMDVILALGVTNCKRILFVGSAGGLTDTMNIGDIVIPDYSICGNGACHYLGVNFGDKVYPCPSFSGKLKEVTASIRNYHTAVNYSIDTIFAEFYHLDNIISLGCTTIEMETAAAFAAAKVCGISIAALFAISDNTVANKSLISGRSVDDMEYYRHVRRHVYPKIIKGVFK